MENKKINWDEEIELTGIVGTDKAIYTGNKKLDSDQKKIKYEIMVQPKNFNLWVDEYGKMGGAITPYVRNKPKDKKEKEVDIEQIVEDLNYHKIMKPKGKEMKPYLFDLFDQELNKTFRWSSLSTTDEGYNKHVAKILREEADRLDPPEDIKLPDLSNWEQKVPPEFEKTFKEKFWSLLSDNEESKKEDKKVYWWTTELTPWPKEMLKKFGININESDKFKKENKKVYTVEVSKENIKVGEINFTRDDWNEWGHLTRSIDYLNSVLYRDICDFVNKSHKSDEIDWERPIEFIDDPDCKVVFVGKRFTGKIYAEYALVYIERDEICITDCDKDGYQIRKKVVRNKGLL